MKTAATRMFLGLGAILILDGSIGVAISDAQQPSAKVELPNALLTFGSLQLSGDALVVTICRFVTVQEERTYTVKVPVTRELADGEKKTKYVTEARTRVVTLQKPVYETTEPLAEESRLYRVSSERVDSARFGEVLANPQPVIVLKPGQKLGTYYRSIFKSDILVLVLPETPK